MAARWSLTWQQVVALGLVIGGVVAVYVLVPEDKLPPWEMIVSLATILAGGGLGAVSDRLVRRPAPVRVERTTEVPPPGREEGSVDVEALAFVLLWGMAAMLALARVLGPTLVLLVALGPLTGCGGGILATHARAATIALVSIEGAQRALAAGHQAAVAECPDPACVIDVDSRWIPAGVALDSALPVVSAWIGTLEIAELAGTPDAELESVLELAMARAQDVWRQARDALDVVGLELPDLGGGS